MQGEVIRPTPLRPVSDPGNNLETRQKRGSLKVFVCVFAFSVCMSLFEFVLLCIFSVLVQETLMWCTIRSAVLLLLLHSKTPLPLTPNTAPSHTVLPHRATSSSGRSPAVIQVPRLCPLDLARRASLVISQRCGVTQS